MDKQTKQASSIPEQPKNDKKPAADETTSNELNVQELEERVAPISALGRASAE